MWLVPAKNRTLVSSRRACKAARSCSPLGKAALAALVMIGFVIGNVVAVESPSRGLEQQVATALDAVQNNRGLAVPSTLRDLERLPPEVVVAEMKTRYADPDPQGKLGLTYAMARYGEVDVPFLVSQIQGSAPEEADNLRQLSVRAREQGLIVGHPCRREKAAGGSELASQGPLGCRGSSLPGRPHRRRHVPHRRSARSGPAHDLHRRVAGMARRRHQTGDVLSAAIRYKAAVGPLSRHRRRSLGTVDRQAERRCLEVLRSRIGTRPHRTVSRNAHKRGGRGPCASGVSMVPALRRQQASRARAVNRSSSIRWA